MVFSELIQRISSTGFPSRIITALGLAQAGICDRDKEAIPRRYESMCNEARDLLAITDDDDVSVYSCPGRIMYAGLHGHRNGGLSLGSAVNPDIVCILRPRDDGQIVLYSQGYDHAFHIDSSETTVRPDERGDATAIIRGASAKIAAMGYQSKGFDAFVQSDIPPGSGLDASSAFTVLMLNCLYDTSPGTKGNLPLSAEEVGAAVTEIESEYFGEPGYPDSAAIMATGGLVLCDHSGTFVASRIDQNRGFFDMSHTLIDGLSAGQATEAAWEHLHGELEAIRTVHPDSLFKGDLLDRLNPEEAVLFQFFYTESVRIRNMVHALRQGNADRLSRLYQDYLHEYRHLVNLIKGKSAAADDKLELLHSILSIYKLETQREILHGPAGEGLDAQVIYLHPSGGDEELTAILHTFFEFLTIRPIFPRDKGCTRIL